MANGEDTSKNPARIVDFQAYKDRKQIVYVDDEQSSIENHPSQQSTATFYDGEKLGWFDDLRRPRGQSHNDDSDPTPPHGMPRPKY